MSQVQSGQRPASLFAVMAVMFGFFVMGFVDLIGKIAVHAEMDFSLSKEVASFLPSAVFLWFFVCAVPTGLLMNKLGRRNTVLLSLILTVGAFILPSVAYNKYTMFAAVALLGIGNAVIQVALNPLVSNVVRRDQLTSFLTAGQFIKAIASFLGPIVVAKLVAHSGNLQMVFQAYVAASIVGLLWIGLSNIPREQETAQTASFGECLGLLGDRRLLALFCAIIVVVGFDVGMNCYTSTFEQEVWGLPLVSVYFAGRTAGAFVGSLILAKVPISMFMRISVVIMIGALAAMLGVKAESMQVTGVLVALAAIGGANIFSMVFSWAIQHKPEKANEISGLLIMGVAGGAVSPPLMAFAFQKFGAYGSIGVLLACGAYLAALAVLYRDNKSAAK